MIAIICGLPGTGKTDIAKKLASIIDAVVLSTDEIRKELIPNPTYQRKERELIFDVVVLLAKYLHSSHKRCILDATFNKESSRNQVKNDLIVSENQFFVVECTCPEKIILKKQGIAYAGSDFKNKSSYKSCIFLMNEMIHRA